MRAITLLFGMLLALSSPVQGDAPDRLPNPHQKPPQRDRERSGGGARRN